MILLDTNILIEILKNDLFTIQRLKGIEDELTISSISVMELYYGAINKNELKKLEKFVHLFKIIHISEDISLKSMQLINKYAKSHSLDIPDALIASTAISNNCKLFTYNLKDFRFIDELILF